jgi:hypothetical protein
MIESDPRTKSDQELISDWHLLWMHLSREALTPQTKFKYTFLAKDYYMEMKKRKFNARLPRAISPVTFIHDAVLQVGSSVKTPDSANDIDILIRFPKPLPELEKTLDVLLNPELDLHFLYEPLGPDRSYKSLGDLILYPFSRPIIPSLNVNILKPFAYTDNNKIYILYRTPGIAIKLGRIFGAEVEEIIEPEKDMKPLYWLALSRNAEQKIIDLEVRLFEPIQPLKSQAGYGEFTFYDIDEFWKHYGEENLPIYIEPKIDGVRLMLHSNGNKVAIYTEDKKRDRAEFLPEMVEDAKLVGKDMILDGECIIPNLERADMIKIINSKTPVTGVKYYVFDIIYLDGKDLTELPFEERRKILHDTLSGLANDFSAFVICPGWKITSYQDFVKYRDDAINYPHSEGFMAKRVDSKYDLSGRTSGWSKYKSFLECKAQVIGIHRKVVKPMTGHKPIKGEEAIALYKEMAKDSQVYLLRCAMFDKDNKLVPIETVKKLTEDDVVPYWDGKEWHGLECPELWEMDPKFGDRHVGDYAYGSTYAKRLEIPPKLGDIVTIRPKRISRFIKDDGSVGYSWENPILQEQDPERDKPDKIAPLLETKMDYSDEGPKEEIDPKIYYMSTPKPTKAVMQLHVRGIYDTESRELLVEELMKADRERVDEIWKKENLFWVKSMSALAKDLKSTESARGDLAAAFERHISHKPIDDLSNVWNKGNVHIDFRIKHPDEEYLVGWTIDQPKISMQNLHIGEIVFPLGFGILEDIGSLTIIEMKPPQPLAWLTLVNREHSTFEAKPGGVGATANTSAIFEWFGFFDVLAGVCKPYFFEYFIRVSDTKSDILKKVFSNWRRIDFKHPDGTKLWYGGLDKANKPYLSDHEKEKGDILWNDYILDIIK